MEKKITKKERFEEIKGILQELERPELVAFCEHEIELLAKKKNTGVSKASIENETIGKMLVEELGKLEKPATITEFMALSPVVKNYKTIEGKTLSNQKISYILNDLATKGIVKKTTDKKRTVFSV